jgi:hypothetical protein
VPLVAESVLLGVADRLAKQYSVLKAAFGAMNLDGGGLYWERVSATGDVDVEVPCMTPYEVVDNETTVELGARAGTRFSLIIGGMESHFNRRDAENAPLQLGGWDGYLQAKNKRVSQYFAELYANLGRGYMRAVNVFSEGDDVLATIEIDGDGVAFTDGMDYGDGKAANWADGEHFAASRLRVTVDAMGDADLDMNVVVKTIANLPKTISVHIPANTPAETDIDLGDETDRLLDVTAVSYTTGGGTGTVGDAVRIRNIKEREIAL